MSIKWMGAMLIMAGCGGFGLSICAGYRRELRHLEQLVYALGSMEWELQYRLTPLPELCRMAGKEAGGVLRQVFRRLADALDHCEEPDAAMCMRRALRQTGALSPRLNRLMNQLGRSLGRYDLTGQIQGLHAVKIACREEQRHLEAQRESRIRSYQTLSLCAGAALVILFA